MQALCPRCGMPSEGGLCKSCALETTKIFSCPDQVEVVICSVCGSQHVKGRWLQPDDRDEEEMAASAAADAVWLHRDLAGADIDVDLKKVGATRYLAAIDITGSFQGEPVSLQCSIAVRVKMMACDRCSRIAGKYFESTVQLRGNAGRAITAREMEECKKMAGDMADAGYRAGEMLSFIQEMKEVKGGLDIILGSTQLGRRMARAFQERFGGRLLETAKLVGKKDSRDVFRTTLLVRFPRLQRGDIVSFRGSLAYVSGFDGKATLLTTLREGRRTSMSEENSQTVPVLGNRGDAVAATVISADRDVLEIMDPETFRSALAARPKGQEVRPGEEVMVVRTADGFIVL